MPVHSLILMNAGGDILYKTHFLKPAILDYNCQLYFEQRLYKSTAALWTSTSSTPFSLLIGDVMVICQRIGDIIVFLSGVDDIDEPIRESNLNVLLDALLDRIYPCGIVVQIAGVIEKVLQEVLDGKVTEAGLLVPENLGKFVVCVDDMMPMGIVETLDAGLIGRLSKLKAVS